MYSIKCSLGTVGSVDVYICIIYSGSKLYIYIIIYIYQHCILTLLHSAAVCIACELGHGLKWQTREPCISIYVCDALVCMLQVLDHVLFMRVFNH